MIFSLRSAALRGLAAALLALPSCSPPAAPPKAPRSAPLPVRTAPAVRKNVPLLLPAIGQVRPGATVTIRPQVSGQLAATHFREGQSVQRGDLLFSIEPKPFAVALQSAQAALDVALAEAAQAAAQEQRYAQLQRGGSVAAELVEQAHTASLTAAARVAAAQAAAQEAQLALDYCRILAPLSGRLGRLLLDPGNLVQASLTELAIINQLQPAEVTFTLAGRHLPALRLHSASQALPVTASPEGSTSPQQGTLAFFDNAVRPATGTIEVLATFPNDAQILWPGQFVDVRLALSESAQALTIPALALQSGQDGPYVYRIGPSLLAELQPVKIDRFSDGDALVLEGLAEGDQVVVDGQSFLRPRAPVEILPPRPAPVLP